MKSIQFVVVLAASWSSVAMADLQPNFASIHENIFVRSCTRCHSGEERSAAPNLNSRAALVEWVNRAGDRAVNVEEPEQSTLYKRIVSTNPEFVMPKPRAQLPVVTAEESTLILEWIRLGAPN